MLHREQVPWRATPLLAQVEDREFGKALCAMSLRNGRSKQACFQGENRRPGIAGLLWIRHASVNSLFARGMQTIQVVCRDSAPTDLSFLSPSRPSRFQSIAFNFRRSSSNSRWIRSRSAWAANCTAFRLAQSLGHPQSLLFGLAFFRFGLAFFRFGLSKSSFRDAEGLPRSQQLLAGSRVVQAMKTPPARDGGPAPGWASVPRRARWNSPFEGSF